MSYISDYKVGAIDDDEYRFYANRESREFRAEYDTLTEKEMLDYADYDEEFAEFMDDGYTEGWDYMTNEEAKAIIRKEYLCVDRDCDIERSCGRCDLMMPSKEPILEAFRMAMDLLDRNATTKDCLGVDLISRQAVIDAIDKWYEDNSGDLVENAIEDLIIAMNYNIPSVNPTKTEHDCYECEKYKESEE